MIITFDASDLLMTRVTVIRWC